MIMVPRSKAHKSIGCPRLRPPGASHSPPCPHSTFNSWSELPLRYSYQFMAAAALGLGVLTYLVTWLWLSGFVCLSRFGGWWFALWPQLSNGSQRRHWFSVGSLFFSFHVVSMGVTTSKLFTRWNRNWKSLECDFQHKKGQHRRCRKTCGPTSFL